MTGTAPKRGWTPEDLLYLADTRELEISTPRPSGTPGPWTPIWVVVVADGVFVRTWHRRTTGWYGRAVGSGRARIRVSGETVDANVEATGVMDADAVNAAYRTKYGAGGALSMITDEAVASTLRLTRAS